MIYAKDTVNKTLLFFLTYYSNREVKIIFEAPSERLAKVSGEVTYPHCSHCRQDILY
jgi:hypothetical protein